MIQIETNLPAIVEDLLAILQGVPRIVFEQQGDLQSIISRGITEQFDALGRGEPVTDANGAFVSWEPISRMTEIIRETRWDALPDSPILVVTGSMRRGLQDGVTYVYDQGNQSILTYLPSVTQEDRIQKHEEGFRVTEPVDIGKTAPARPMLFWGEELSRDIYASLERGIDNLARSRGFR